METLAKLLAHQRQAGDVEPAVHTALQLLTLDPLKEPVLRTLMRLYVQLGRGAAALRQNRVCVTALERELRAEPKERARDGSARPARGPGAGMANGAGPPPPRGRHRGARARRRRPRHLFEAVVQVPQRLAVKRPLVLLIDYSRVLGSAHALAGNLDEAMRLLGQAVEESRAIRLLYGYAILVIYLGETCLWAGRFEEAERFALEALAVARERGERGDEGWALHLTAEVAARREPPDLDRAAAAYREALAIAVALEMRPLEARCHLGLGAVLRRGRVLSEARELARRATDLFASLGIERWRREAEALSIELAG